MGENPAMSDPDVDHAREALAALDHLVVQDIFLTETAYLADVVLPSIAWPEKIGTVTNTDRMVQLGARRSTRLATRGRTSGFSTNWRAASAWIALRASPRGLRRDADVHGLDRRHHLGSPRARFVCHLSVRPSGSGRSPSSSATPSRPSGTGRSYWPISLPRRNGRTRSTRWCSSPAATGTLHTGSMTRRAANLDFIEPEPVALHPLDLEAMKIAPAGIPTIESRRGKISLYARADDGTPRGTVFVPFCFYEAAANMLTNPVLDPFGKIPEFKCCAVE